MARTLVIAEIYEGEFRSSTLHAVKAASVLKEKTGAEYDILAIGSAGAAQQAQNYGAGKVLHVDAAGLAHYLARPWAATIAAVAKSGNYDTLVMTSTTMGKDLCPRVAALLDAGMASDITGIVDAANFERPIYAGNVLATVTIETPIKVISARSTGFDKAEAGAAASPIESTQATEVTSKETFDRYEAAAGGDRPDLADAKIVVSGGRGTKGDFAPIYKLADALGAAVGASRAVVDAGWAPNDWQVGQTGKVVAPALYFAVGISGAIQHWAGMKDSKCIVAINKDPEAPIMELADYAIVADLFQAAPELATKLDGLKASGEITL